MRCLLVVRGLGVLRVLGGLVAAHGHPGGGEDAARVALEPPLGQHGDDPAVRLGAGGDGPAHAVGGRVEDVADGDRHRLAAAALEHGGDAVGVVGEGVAVSGRGRVVGGCVVGVLQQLGTELRQPDDEGPQVPPAAFVAQRVELGPLVGDDLLARLRPLLLGAQTTVEVVEPGEHPVQDVRDPTPSPVPAPARPGPPRPVPGVRRPPRRSPSTVRAPPPAGAQSMTRRSTIGEDRPFGPAKSNAQRHRGARCASPGVGAGIMGLVHVVFVCSGNICRSPVAEKVFRARLADAGLTDAVEVSSAGIGSWHAGEPMDRRAAATLRGRGLRHRAPGAAGRPPISSTPTCSSPRPRTTCATSSPRAPTPERVVLLRSFDPDAPEGAEVPDPYYGGPRRLRRGDRDGRGRDARARRPGAPVTSVESLLAGSGRGVQTATLDDGTEVVVKSGEPSAIAAEAAGLRWLAEPGAVAVPEVLGTAEGRMVSTRVPSGRADAGAAERFGRELAALHAAGAPAFGSPPPGGPVHAWIGEARMVNETGDDWPSWYAEHRVLPYARQARDQGTFSADDVALVERACAPFPERRRPGRAPGAAARRPVDRATCCGTATGRG